MAAQLISMKMDPAEAAEYNAPSVAPGEAPAYPWGLCLDLNDEVLQKLGIPLPSVDQLYTLVARVEVTRASATETQDGGKEISCSLQITEMQLQPDAGGDPASKLWPDKE